MAVLMRYCFLEAIVLASIKISLCNSWAKVEWSSNSELIRVKRNVDNNVIEVKRPVELGYCVTWDNDTDEIVMVNCPYYIAHPICNRTLTLNNGSNLTEEMCNIFNRKGPHCGKCISGYGPAAFSAQSGLPCANCSKPSRVLMFLLYLLLELMCVTILYVAFVLFQLRLTASPLNVMVYFSQVIVNVIAVNPFTYTSITCVIHESVLQVLLTFYGIWNLDFFRYLIPPICVSSSVANIHVLLFDYIIACYPILLTIVLYYCIVLHDQRNRVIFCLWRPFRYCILRLRRVGNMNPRESIINTFASFILLSYSKLLYTSLSLLYCEQKYLYENPKTILGKVLYYDPTIPFLSKKHAPFAFMAFFVITFLVILPPFLLLIYPTHMFGRLMESCRFPRQDILQLFMDTFQGWYKDGTEGTRDYRQVSSLYMFMRVVIGITLLMYKALHRFDETSLTWVVVGLLHGGLGVFFLVVRPYKISYMNPVDGTILLLLGTMAITSGQSNSVVQHIAISLAAVPLVTCILYFSRSLWKLVQPYAQPCLLKSVQCLEPVCRDQNGPNASSSLVRNNVGNETQRQRHILHNHGTAWNSAAALGDQSRVRLTV